MTPKINKELLPMMNAELLPKIRDNDIRQTQTPIGPKSVYRMYKKSRNPKTDSKMD